VEVCREIRKRGVIIFEVCPPARLYVTSIVQYSLEFGPCLDFLLCNDNVTTALVTQSLCYVPDVSRSNLG